MFESLRTLFSADRARRPARPRRAEPLRLEALEAREVPTTAQTIGAYYNDLLSRSASQSEINTWINTGLSVSQIAQGILTSTENYQNQVRNMYQEYLQRTPSNAEISGWVQQLQSGATDFQVRSQILGSQEFFQFSGGTNTQFLNGVYLLVLDRFNSPTEINSWLAMLQTKTRQQVALDILLSQESGTIQVGFYYQFFLNRSSQGDPGSAGWVSQLTFDQQLSVLTGILGSQEYQQKAEQFPPT